MSDRIPPLVDAAWLQARLTDPRLRVLDATVLLDVPEGDGPYSARPGRDDYEQGHVPGATFADIIGELSDPDSPFLFTLPPVQRAADALGRLGIGDDATVVVYDTSFGAWASRLWWQLRVLGFDRVAVLDGGWRAWLDAGFDVETGTSSYAAATFTPRPRPALVATREEIVAELGRGDTVLLHTLDDATFAGEGPQRYARRGRIPGSDHLPSATLVDATTGRLRPPEELRTLLESRDVLAAPRTVAYCGSGISATTVALAAAIIGIDDVAVYDGSLTEWTADPELPLEVD